MDKNDVERSASSIGCGKESCVRQPCCSLVHERTNVRVALVGDRQ
jgi:hypothetical protein